MLKKISYISCIIMLLLFISTLLSYAAINSDFTPQWKVGDSWDTVMRRMPVAVSPGSLEDLVEYKGPGEVTYIHFEVIDLKEIDGEMCYAVDITYKNPTNKYDANVALQLYVRQDDFTLKKVLELIKESDGLMHVDDFHTSNNGRDFVIFDTPFNISIPCDFPNFPPTNTNEERTIKLLSGLTVTQKVTFIDENNVQIELFTKFGTRSLKITQIWERGKPWWSSCKREFTYKDYETGEMKTRVEYDPVLVGIDTTPPVLQLSVTPTTLWPPNHEMVEIAPTVTATDDYDRYPDIKLESITSNEPDDAVGEGDGHTTQDIQTTKVWDSKQRKMFDKISLRAERAGIGSGRIYTITYSATDFSGNKSTASATVTVPHDMGE